MNYAKIEGTKVINIEVASPEWVSQQPNKEQYVPYTTENPAEPGGDYIDGFFYKKQPFPSWTRDGAGNWSPPIKRPNVEKFLIWDEKILNWVEPDTL